MLQLDFLLILFAKVNIDGVRHLSKAFQLIPIFHIATQAANDAKTNASTLKLQLKWKTKTCLVIYARSPISMI